MVKAIIKECDRRTNIRYKTVKCWYWLRIAIIKKIMKQADALFALTKDLSLPQRLESFFFKVSSLRHIYKNAKAYTVEFLSALESLNPDIYDQDIIRLKFVSKLYQDINTMIISKPNDNDIHILNATFARVNTTFTDNCFILFQFHCLCVSTDTNKIDESCGAPVLALDNMLYYFKLRAPSDVYSFKNIKLLQSIFLCLNSLMHAYLDVPKFSNAILSEFLRGSNSFFDRAFDVLSDYPPSLAILDIPIQRLQLLHWKDSAFKETYDYLKYVYLQNAETSFPELKRAWYYYQFKFDRTQSIASMKKYMKEVAEKTILNGDSLNQNLGFYRHYLLFEGQEQVARGYLTKEEYYFEVKTFAITQIEQSLQFFEQRERVVELHQLATYYFEEKDIENFIHYKRKIIEYHYINGNSIRILQTFGYIYYGLMMLDRQQDCLELIAYVRTLLNQDAPQSIEFSTSVNSELHYFAAKCIKDKAQALEELAKAKGIAKGLPLVKYELEEQIIILQNEFKVTRGQINEIKARIEELAARARILRQDVPEILLTIDSEYSDTVDVQVNKCNSLIEQYEKTLEKQQMWMTIGLCSLASVLVAGAVIFMVKRSQQ
ncbi:hypothetical protein FGO68_gene14677 [Halteria grandinella]|uniref:Uncharacterized protein n=1 Tax=Halteria grandinella TaxID=5974 RepID=A0A8J8NXL6_HALGN|nr:hypothetical protein FGO68_gene14677 [Halteria grandinella]